MIILNSHSITQGQVIHDMLAAGWVILPASCQCGGSFAWLKPRVSGAKEMVGCVCHSTFKAISIYLDELEDI